METRTRRNYYDASALGEQFSPDAHEIMMDDTNGLGFAKLDREGRPWHRNRKSGEVEPLTLEQVDQTYLGGDSIID